MIQPASSLLFNRSGTANRFREKLFSKLKVEEVVNLSTLRFELFQGATSPPCIVTLRPIEPDGEPLVYVSPKQVKQAGGAEVAETQYTIVIEPHDVSRIWPDEAGTEPLVWTALAWGGRRDLVFVKRLLGSDSLATLENEGIVSRRKGIVRGDLQKAIPELKGRRILETASFPLSTFLLLQATELPVNENEYVDGDDSTTLEPFQIPQLILKKSWQANTGRVQAARVLAGKKTGGVLCSQSYVSVHAPLKHVHHLDDACLSYNSRLAVYFLLLTSGRLASYRPEPVVSELLRVPIAPTANHNLKCIEDYDQVDALVLNSIGLKDSEAALIEDLVEYTMPDFKGDETSPGRQLTERVHRFTQPAKSEPHLSAYCKYFARVLNAGFGQDKAVCATIFQDTADSPLPVRLAAIHLDWPREKSIVVERIDSASLCDLLMELDEKWLQSDGQSRGGIFYQRVAFVYLESHHEGRAIPTIYVIKPDRIRYWTRSAAMRDADEVASDIQLWKRQT